MDLSVGKKDLDVPVFAEIRPLLNFPGRLFFFGKTSKNLVDAFSEARKVHPIVRGLMTALFDVLRSLVSIVKDLDTFFENVVCLGVNEVDQVSTVVLEANDIVAKPVAAFVIGIDRHQSPDDAVLSPHVPVDKKVRELLLFVMRKEKRADGADEDPFLLGRDLEELVVEEFESDDRSEKVGVRVGANDGLVFSDGDVDVRSRPGGAWQQND